MIIDDENDDNDNDKWSSSSSLSYDNGLSYVIYGD
jgi:hypothetical protein